MNCNCDRLIKIHHDSEDTEVNAEEHRKCDSQVVYQWYQSKEIFKGFKFLR